MKLATLYKLIQFDLIYFKNISSQVCFYDLSRSQYDLFWELICRIYSEIKKGMLGWAWTHPSEWVFLELESRLSLLVCKTEARSSNVLYEIVISQNKVFNLILMGASQPECILVSPQRYSQSMKVEQILVQQWVELYEDKPLEHQWMFSFIMINHTLIPTWQPLTQGFSIYFIGWNDWWNLRINGKSYDCIETWINFPAIYDWLYVF